MPDLATLDIAAPVATLTLNRAEARNALSIDLLAALHRRLDELEKRTDVVALVVTGAGKSFCAGADLKDVLGSPEAPLRLASSFAEFLLRLRRLPAITVAAVNGAAIGGGCGFAAACDFAVTHADSRMGFPEVDLGVCPAVVAPWLVRKIGAGRARRVLLGGGTMTGREAHAIGIVTDLVETRDQLDGAVQRLTGHIAAGGPAALRITKDLLNRLDGSLDAELARQTAELSASVFADPVTQESLRKAIG
jgi:methylglutaconyl-CoA hydratase